MVLAAAAVMGAVAGATAAGAEPDRTLRDLFLPAQLLSQEPATEMPSPQEEAEVAPGGELLPSAEVAAPADATAPSAALRRGPSVVQLGDGADESLEPMEIGELAVDSTGLPAPVYSSGTWFRGGDWYAQTDIVMMDQRRLSRGTVPNARAFLLANGSGFPKGVLAYDTFAGTTLRRFSRNFMIDSLTQHFEPGTRLTLGHFFGRDASNRDHALEFSYLGLFEWDARAEFEGVGASFGEPPASIRTVLGGVVTDSLGNPTAIFVPGFSDADIQRFEYSSEFNSFEWNLRLQARPSKDILALQPDGEWIRHDASSRLFSLVGGLRYMSINDRFQLQSQSAEQLDDQGEVDVPEMFGLYTVRTHNDMVGVQLGMEMLEKYTSWNWGIRSRVGGFTNFAERTSDIFTVNGIDPRSQTIEDTSFVTLLEGGVFLAYQVRPNTAIRTAYDAIYLPSGTADAQRNLSLQPTFPNFNTTGRRLYQGISVGLEMNW